MAGTGKSAISTTFAENMEDDGLLGATFFVDRQIAELTDPHRIVQSLAYDLAERDHDRLRRSVHVAVHMATAIAGRAVVTAAALLLRTNANGWPNKRTCTVYGTDGRSNGQYACEWTRAVQTAHWQCPFAWP
jgi:hypothetical protein